ncbi:MAG: potassium/proton antiporter [Rhodocyclaceae bacterium]|nr:potassium/proton antiporter [Rhodocyclaceae bacterium]
MRNDPTRRIIVNTIAQYAKAIVNIGLSLYSTRLILDALSISDYGIYAVVGGVVAMLGFITNGLVVTTQRYISFYHGRGEQSFVGKVFTNSLFLHIVFGLAIGLVLLLLKDWLFDGVLNIPVQRVETAGNVYLITIAMLFITIVTAPFKALFIARENIVYVSAVEVCDGIIKLLFAIALTFVTADRLMVYAFTSLLQGSGILAVYLAGIVIGNRRSHAIEHVLHVMDGLAWLSQAGMFVVLGLLVNPTMLAVHPVESLLLALFLMLVARPLAVFSSLWFFRFTWREMLYISWVGLRGAVPVVLAMYPMVMGVERGAAMLLFTVAFTVVVLSLLLQGSTIARVARWLDMVVPPKPGPLDRREIWMNRKTALELVQYQVGANARAIDHYPEAFVRQETGDGVYFAAALRGDKMLGRTQKLQAGDYIWLFTPESAIASLTPAFAANDAEELAQSAAFFGEFTLEATHGVDSVADVYGLQLEENERGMTLAAFFVRRLGRPPVEGDRISVGAFEMTARAVERGQVARVGLKFSDH